MSTASPSKASNGGRMAKAPFPPPVGIPDHQLLARIGEGSYGQVWLARSATGKDRAVKIVRNNTEDAGRGFEREFIGIQHYEPISRTHPALMQILHVGRDEQSRFFYYVMELADDTQRRPDVPPIASTLGKVSNQGSAFAWSDSDEYVPDTLKHRIRNQRRLPVDECIQIGLALTDGLTQLHKAGLVHRDIKPSNIIFVSGQAKLTDIGLVTSIGAARSLVGTLGYFPPEGPGSAGADLYSLGKVLYEASSGKDLEEFPEPATSLDSDEIGTWAELNEIILKACKPSAEQRYQTAEAMHTELTRLRAGASIRHLRTVERRLAALRKFAGVGAAVVMISGAGLFFKANEAEKFRQVAQESSLRLRQLHLANGIRTMEDGDLPTSLVWFTEGLRLTEASQPAIAGSATTGLTAATPAPMTDAKLQRQRWEAISRQCPRIVRIGAHDGPVPSAVFSPDGHRVLTASLDQTACLWNLSDGERVWRVAHPQPLTYATFNRAGSRIVTCCEDGAARVCDVATGQLIYPPLRHAAKVLYAAFSPDGRRLVTCGADATARLWNADSGQSVRIVFKTTGEANYAEFSPDGRWFVTASDDCTARVYDAFSGQPVSPSIRHPDHVRQARFSLDGRRIVTACRDGNARVFDAQSGILTIPPMKHTTPLLYAMFTSDDTRVLAGGGAADTDGEVLVWDAGSGGLVSRPTFLTGRSRTSAVSPDGRYVATATQEKSLFLWDMDTGRLIAPPLHHNNSVWDVHFSADGRQLLSTSRDGAWRLWELAVGSAFDLVWHHPDPVNGASFMKDDHRVLLIGFTQSGHQDSGLWETTSATYTALGTPSTGPPIGAAFSSTRTRIAILYHSGQMLIHDGEEGKVLTVLHGCTNGFGLLSFSPDDKMVLVPCRDQVVRFWRTSDGEATGPSLVHDQTIYAAVFSRDGQVVATGSGTPGDAPGGGKVQIWSTKTGQQICSPIEVDGNPVLAVSPNSRRLLVGTKDSAVKPHFAQLRDLTTGEAVGPELWHGDGVSCVAFTPDGSKVVTGGEDGACRLWDAETGRPSSPWLLHKRGIVEISFAPDGRRMVTASSDGTARIWDTVTGEALSPSLSQRDRIACACFSNDGRALATGSYDRTCRIWRLPSNDRPLHDLDTMARLQSGLRIDDTGGLSPLAASDLVSTWRRLFLAYPSDFAVSNADQLAWHRLQEADCEAAELWAAARFHLAWMLRSHQTDTRIQHRLAIVETHLRPRPADSVGHSIGNQKPSAKQGP